MPGLTVDIDQHVSSSPSQPSNQQSPRDSKSSSPTRPPYSPITPVLTSAQLATVSTPTPPTAPTPQVQQLQQQQQQAPARIYTHSQTSQTFLPAPPVPPETVSLEENPDALALKAALSILQLQRQRAINDLQTLQKIKKRALADPTAFAEALTSGKINAVKKDPLFNPACEGQGNDDGDSDSDEGLPSFQNEKMDTEMRDTAHESNGDIPMMDRPQRKTEPWPTIPTPQSIVRTPPINWTQYGIIGDSLDKLHADQVARPNEGLPARIGPDGVAAPVEGGRRAEGVIAAPLQVGKDRIDRKKGKKNGN